MGNKLKLFIYSDCYIYGGSEKLVSFIIKNNIIKDNCQITFAFRNHKIYREAIDKEYNQEEKKGVVLLPVPILSNSTFFYKINLLKIPSFLKKTIKIPFFIIDKLGFFFIFNLLVQTYLLLKFAPDIVHVNNGGYPGARSCNTMVVAAKLMRVSTIVYQINNITFKTNNIISKYVDRYINNHVDCFITASKHSKKKLIEDRRFDSEKIIQIPNTILEEKVTKSRRDILTELRIDEADFILCNIGFLLKSKGQKYLLEALDFIRTQDPLCFEKLNLLLVGNGEEENDLKRCVDFLNLKKQVHFLGYQSRSVNYLNCCDLFVFPSISGEDMPLVILSAMNLGKTILASDFAGIREEIEDNKSGVLISTNTETLSQTLATEIMKLYHNKQHLMGDNAKVRYNDLFSNAIYGKKILNIYNSFIKTKNLNSKIVERIID
ncbi:MAG: glycosyltransferase family 4 protein [Bacteroidota bacterium]